MREIVVLYGRNERRRFALLQRIFVEGKAGLIFYDLGIINFSFFPRLQAVVVSFRKIKRQDTLLDSFRIDGYGIIFLFFGLFIITFFFSLFRSNFLFIAFREQRRFLPAFQDGKVDGSFNGTVIRAHIQPSCVKGVVGTG